MIGTGVDLVEQIESDILNGEVAILRTIHRRFGSVESEDQANRNVLRETRPDLITLSVQQVRALLRKRYVSSPTSQ
jgi:hypothetical protein